MHCSPEAVQVALAGHPVDSASVHAGSAHCPTENCQRLFQVNVSPGTTGGRKIELKETNFLKTSFVQQVEAKKSIFIVHNIHCKKIKSI